MTFSIPSILIPLLIFATLIGLAIRFFWSHRSTTTSHTSGQPACGNCGYPARGISTLNCPECGADLRAVGIVRPGNHAVVNHGCLLPVVFSMVIVFFAALLLPQVRDMLPNTWRETSSMMLLPDSGEYSILYFNTELVIPYDAGLSYPPTQGQYTSTSSTSGKALIEFTAYTNTPTIHHVSLSAKSPGFSATGTKMPVFEVDSDTRQATWNDPSGRTYQSTGPFTRQDVLAYLGVLGADTTKNSIQDEAGELHGLLDGFSAGMNRFTLSHFEALGHSGGSGHGGDPAWFKLTYFAVWITIWIIGLIVINRLGRVSGKKS